MKTTIDLTEAIRNGILTFEQACALQGMTVEVSAESAEKPAKKPRKTRKTAAKKQDTPAPKQEAETPEAPKEPVYTKGGLLLQWGDEIAAKGKEKGTITKAYNTLTSAGFEVIRKRCGSWMFLYQPKENKRPSSEFNAVKLDKGWFPYKGGWAYEDLFADYEDCVRA